MKIAVDAMGGDNAPIVQTEGAVLAAKQWGILKTDSAGHHVKPLEKERFSFLNRGRNILERIAAGYATAEAERNIEEIILVGKEELIKEKLKRHDLSKLPITIYNAAQVVGMDEQPATACKQKRDSSIMVAARLVKEGRADAFVSAGSTGATMTSALLNIGRLKNVLRPALATTFPSLSGAIVLLDVGANVDCKPKHLQQFAIMGHIFAEKIMQIPNPKVGLLSIGHEETKGNELILASYPLLKRLPFNFIGNIEGKDIANGNADVVVCDGFVGNIALKFAESLADMVIRTVKKELAEDWIGKVAGIMALPAIRRFRRRVDYSEYGGVPLLGVDGVCIIGHGASSSKAIKNAIRVAAEFVSNRVNELIKESIEKYAKEDNNNSV